MEEPVVTEDLYKIFVDENVAIKCSEIVKDVSLRYDWKPPTTRHWHLWSNRYLCVCDWNP